MSEENKKDDQTLASVSFILGLLLVGVAIFTLNKMDRNSDKSNALNRAGLYAQQLIDKGFEVEMPVMLEEETLSRGIASAPTVQKLYEGPLGVDPWGYPFQYVVDKKESSLSGKMIVWSGGPDNQFQTQLADVKRTLAENKNVKFTGDDFGKVINFKLDSSHKE